MPTERTASLEQHEALQALFDDILACPVCHARLELQEIATSVRCTGCPRRYPIVHGIPVLLSDGQPWQEEERKSRDVLADDYLDRDHEALLTLISQNHAIPLMRRRAEQFRVGFRPSDWILDLGVGNGWQWVSGSPGGKLLGIDLSLGNLRLAQRLLRLMGQEHVLVCADAAALPIRARSVSGLWSVQTFQHFPKAVLLRTLAELDRVLTDPFVIEIHNLNPALLQQAVAGLLGKPYHLRGRLGAKELNRLSAREWIALWSRFREGRCRVRSGYSELFFHPRFRLFQRRYPVKLEEAVSRYAPGAAALFARQVWIRIETGGSC